MVALERNGVVITIPVELTVSWRMIQRSGKVIKNSYGQSPNRNSCGYILSGNYLEYLHNHRISTSSISKVRSSPAKRWFASSVTVKSDTSFTV